MTLGELADKLADLQRAQDRLDRAYFAAQPSVFRSTAAQQRADDRLEKAKAKLTELRNEEIEL